MSIPEELWRRFQEGDPRALARALTLVESGHPAGRELLKRVRGKGRAKVVGVTGSPGAGKSTLTDRLILEARKRGERVAVLAVDPSSPFSGGAILGDRIRMMRHHQDPGVYIRSMASRGALGGLAGATVAALSLLGPSALTASSWRRWGWGRARWTSPGWRTPPCSSSPRPRGTRSKPSRPGSWRSPTFSPSTSLTCPVGSGSFRSSKAPWSSPRPGPGGGALPSTPRWRPAARGWRPSLRASGPPPPPRGARAFGGTPPGAGPV